MKKAFVIVVFIIVGTLGYFYIKPTSHVECQLKTPNLIQMETSEAMESMKQRGFVLIVRDTTVTNKLATGTIISQYPLPGTLNCDSIWVSVKQN